MEQLYCLIGFKIYCTKTWNPIDNKRFETVSYLPPLTDDSIGKEVDYMMKNGWIPCLEFDAVRLMNGCLYQCLRMLFVYEKIVTGSPVRSSCETGGWQKLTS